MSELQRVLSEKLCPFCGNGEDYVDINYLSNHVYCHFCGESIKLEIWQTRPIEDALQAEINHRDEYIKKLKQHCRVLWNVICDDDGFDYLETHYDAEDEHNAIMNEFGRKED